MEDSAEAFRSLVDSNLVSGRTLEEAAGVSRRGGESLGWVLWRRYYVPHHMIGFALQEFYGCPFWDAEEAGASARALAAEVPPESLAAGRWAPLWRRDQTVCVVVDDPASKECLAQVRAAFPGARVLVNVGLKEEISRLAEALRLAAGPAR